MGPGGKEKKVSRDVIDHKTRVSNAVFSLRPATILSHVHGGNHGPPGAPAIRGTADAHVDILLQVPGIVVPDIIRGDKGSPPGGDQSRDTVRCHAVIPGRTNFNGQPMRLDAGGFHLEPLGLYRHRERLGERFNTTAVHMHIEQVVFYICVPQGLARESMRLDFPFGRYLFRNGYCGNGHIFVQQHRDLPMMHLNDDGQKERNKGRHNAILKVLELRTPGLISPPVTSRVPSGA